MPQRTPKYGFHFNHKPDHVQIHKAAPDIASDETLRILEKLEPGRKYVDRKVKAKSRITLRKFTWDT